MHSMLHTKFQASEQSDFEEEDFYFFFYEFLLSQPRTPVAVPSWTCSLDLNKLDKRLLGNATYQISSI